MNTNTQDLVCKKCGVINDYTVKDNSPHFTAYCKCGAYIKHTGNNPNLPNVSDNQELINYIGKYKGIKISEISDVSWIEWVIVALSTSMNYKYLQAFQDRLDDIKYNSL